MHFKFQLIRKKRGDAGQGVFQVLLILIQDHEIIRVSDVVMGFKLPFHELVELIHVHIDEKLARKVAKRKADAASVICSKTADDLIEQPERIPIGNLVPKNLHQNFMIDIGEELSDIAFEHPRSARVIAGDLPRERTKAIHGAVRSFVLPAGVGIVDEQAIEERIELPIDCVMHQTIFYGRLVNIPWLGIVDAESVVRAMPVRLVFQLLVKGNDAICKMHGILDDILTVSLSAQKFFPCREQVFYRDDILVQMKQSPSSLSRKARRSSIASKRDI